MRCGRETVSGGLLRVPPARYIGDNIGCDIDKKS